MKDFLKRRKLVLLATVCLAFLCGASSCAEERAARPADRVVLGDEQFDRYLPLLEGKNVALFSNHTGIVGGVAPFDPLSLDVPLDDLGAAGEHILDALVGRGVKVTAIFCPEHGFRGTADAGESVDDAVDARTGVPILSLYGAAASKALSKDNMARFDALVVDIQDVGLRYYTYYITLHRLMEACAALGKDVLLLDRPNPNGFYVDGPLLREGFRSGVGALPLPIVHGMTLGELARMINGEGWLKAGANACRLTVIPCENYAHSTKVALTRAPSPNIKTMRAVYLYASTCYFENTLVSVARGTEFPFEAYGSPHLKGMRGYEFTFTPQSLPGARKPPFLGQACYGVDLRSRPVEAIWKEQIHLDYLVGAWHALKGAPQGKGFFGAPDKRGQYWLDKLCGTDAVRKMILAGASAAEIRSSWREDVEAFERRRRPYLLYDE